MKPYTSVVRIMFSMAFCLIAASFVSIYVHLQANFYQYGHKFDMVHLPLLTLVYFKYHTAGFLLPLLAALGFFLRHRDHDKQQLLQLTWAGVIALFALVWLLVCVIAWQLPAYYPISIIE